MRGVFCGTPRYFFAIAQAQYLMRQNMRARDGIIQREGEEMQVLYVDVYFLINLTVDSVAAALSAKLLHIKSSLWRILLLASVGAVVAVVDAVFIGRVWGGALLDVLFLLFAAIIVGREISLTRRVKLVVVFLCLEMLLGGIVNYGYRMLDRYVGEFGEYFSAGSANRKALLFSIIILFNSYAVILS